MPPRTAYGKLPRRLILWLEDELHENPLWEHPLVARDIVMMLKEAGAGDIVTLGLIPKEEKNLVLTEQRRIALRA